jgi:hypothetical protein
MTKSAHPNITIVDPTVSRDDIERLYSKKHAEVWQLVRTMGMASEMRPPIFEVVSLYARHAGWTAQARGIRQIERGWLELDLDQEAALQRELPEDPAVLEALASAPLVIDGADVLESPTNTSCPLDPADLIDVMKRERVGRPSTYASHVESTFECAEMGWLRIDDTGCFRVTEVGRLLLEVLRGPDLPGLDKGYTAELESDLDAIERGDRSPAEVLRWHLQRLLCSEVNIPAEALEALGGSALSNELKAETSLQTSQPAKASQLPAEIDPEVVLGPDHPFRVIRAAFDKVVASTFGAAIPNRTEMSRRRACRALAATRLLGDIPAGGVSERLRLDLGLRWVVGLSPTDPVWTSQMLHDVAIGDRETVDSLETAARAALGRASASKATASERRTSRGPESGVPLGRTQPAETA